MEVVTARVHDTGHGRGHGSVTSSGDRQAVHVPTQQTTGRSARSGQPSPRRTATTEVRSAPRVIRGPDPPTPEDAGLGPRVVEAELGSLVQFCGARRAGPGQIVRRSPACRSWQARPTKARRERTSRSSRSRSVCNDSPSAAPAIIRRRSRAKSPAVRKRLSSMTTRSDPCWPEPRHAPLTSPTHVRQHPDLGRREPARVGIRPQEHPDQVAFRRRAQSTRATQARKIGTSMRR